MTPEQWVVMGAGYALFVIVAGLWSYQRWVSKKKYDSIMYGRE